MANATIFSCCDFSSKTSPPLCVLSSCISHLTNSSCAWKIADCACSRATSCLYSVLCWSRHDRYIFWLRVYRSNCDWIAYRLRCVMERFFTCWVWAEHRSTQHHVSISTQALISRTYIPKDQRIATYTLCWNKTFPVGTISRSNQYPSRTFLHFFAFVCIYYTLHALSYAYGYVYGYESNSYRHL